MTALQRPALLALPIEIRLKILQYAFIANCAPTAKDSGFPSPLDVQVVLPPKGRYFKNHWYRIYDLDGSWGLPPFSNLFLINKQLYDEATEVVYCGDFRFQLVENQTVEQVRRFLDTVGEKKALLKNVGVRARVHASNLSIDLLNRWGLWGIIAVKKSLELLVSECTGLKMVYILLDASRHGPVRFGEVGRERVIEALMEFLMIFRGKRIMLSLRGDITERMGVIMECQESSTRQTLSEVFESLSISAE